MRAEYRAEQRQLATMTRLASEPERRSEPDGTRDPELAEALANLDHDQRHALLLHVWGELSYQEVAAVLKIPVGTVRSRISRACAALRETLTERSAHA